MERTITQQQSSGRRTFIILAVIFMGPLLLAAVLFKYQLVPGGATNKGKLIDPPVALLGEELTRLDTEGGMVDTDSLLRGKWTLAFVGSGDCDEICAKNLYHIQQIWIGTNREMTRVQRAWLVADEVGSKRIGKVSRENPGLMVFDATDSTLVPRFPAVADAPIYLIDPQGYLMMSWQRDQDPREMLKDLRKLLRHSKAG